MRTRRSFYTGSLLAVFTLACVIGFPLLGTAQSDHEARDHVPIRISDTGLHPETARLAEGETATWINYSSEPVEISFSTEVAKRIHCKSSSGFRLDESGLRSERIRTRMFASLCRFDPGSYAYQVSTVHGVGTSSESSEVLHEGKIRVE